MLVFIYGRRSRNQRFSWDYSRPSFVAPFLARRLSRCRIVAGAPRMGLRGCAGLTGNAIVIPSSSPRSRRLIGPRLAAAVA